MAKLILFADDEKDIRLLIKDILHIHDYEIMTAKNGEEALKKIEDRRPDLAILDLAMPKMGGFAVCKQIKNDDELKGIPVIILSAFTRDKVGEVSDMANVYMSKPLNQDYFLETVETLLTENPRLAA